MEIASVPSNRILSDSNIMKPNYHLNYGKKRIERAIENKRRFIPLVEAVGKVYTGGIFKRVFVEKEAYGVPYISAQHMMNSNPLEVAKNISKKYTPRQEDMTLKATQILVSCAGTIGNVRLIGEDLDGVIGSQDIIRVISDEKKLPYGYIYAYLASPTAFNYIQSYIYGSVVPRIEPNTLAKLPVPILPETKQLEIHNLIAEASGLRVSANNLLRKIIDEVESQFEIPAKETRFSININEILSGDKYTKEDRLEADFYQPAVKKLEDQIKSTVNYDLLGNLCESITISNLRARTFVKKGIVLFTGQSLGLLKPDLSKQMSKKYTKNIEANTTKNNDILISAFGTLGKTEYCYNNFYTGVFASQQIARIRPNTDKIDPGYIYSFLKSRVGQSLILKYKTGSVIEWANWNNFCSIPIPIPLDRGRKIGDTVRLITKNFDEAYQLEDQAINLIEEEIESWQKL